MELTVAIAYCWSGGSAIYGSGTATGSVLIDGQTKQPGQVNIIYIFPGTPTAAFSCKAHTIPDRPFMVTA